MLSRILAATRAAAGIGLLALLPVGAAHAGACLSGADCTFTLSNTNVTGVTINVSVEVDNTGPNTEITVTYLSSNISNTPLGIDQFGFNSSLAILTQAPGFGSANNCPCQMDGFGKFVSETDSPGGTLTTFSFTLNGQETLFTDNTTGAEFALHIRFSGSCSGFVSDGVNTDTKTDENCTIVRETPEPGTLALIGIAIAGIGYARSRVQRR